MNDRTQMSEEQLDAMAASYDWDHALTNLMLEGWTPDLVALLNSDRPVPPQVRRYLAALLDGKVKLPDRRGKKNSTLSPSDKDAIKTAFWKLYSHTETVLIFADQLADERGIEVIDLRRQMEKVRRDGLKKIAEKFAISENTARQYHDARDTINWTWCRAGRNEIQTADGTILHGFLGKSDDLQQGALSEARDYLQHPDLFFNPLTE